MKRVAIVVEIGHHAAVLLDLRQAILGIVAQSVRIVVTGVPDVTRRHVAVAVVDVGIVAGRRDGVRLERRAAARAAADRRAIGVHGVVEIANGVVGIIRRLHAAHGDQPIQRVVAKGLRGLERTIPPELVAHDVAHGIISIAQVLERVQVRRNPRDDWLQPRDTQKGNMDTGLAHWPTVKYTVRSVSFTK